MTVMDRRRPDCRRRGSSHAAVLLFASIIAAIGSSATAQQAEKFNPTDLPNPYRLEKDWPTLPPSMNGGHWGEVSRVHVDRDDNIWVLHRCFAVEPPGSAVCLGAFKQYPPLLKFDPSGKLLDSFGTGLLAYPHGLWVDDSGNAWVTDVNDQATVLGMSTANAEGVTMGQEVLELSPSGKVLMTLGKEGVSGNGPDTFDRPAGVAVAPNGDVFVADGHTPNAHNSSRIVKFDKTGRFIKAWGHTGLEPGNFNEPHDICIGGSQNRVYVADRRNKRIQVFDQDGTLVAVWPQFGEVNSIFVSKDDIVYAGTAYPDPNYKGTEPVDPLKGKGLIRGIIVGSAKDGSLKAFVPDPVDLTTIVRGSSASGIAADDHGNIYAADVGAHNLRKYVLQGRP